MNKSISTVLLMGQIETNINILPTEPSRPRTTDNSTIQLRNQSLQVNNIQVLITTSKSVLCTIQVLRRIINTCAYGRIGRELQHLSLTIASFERVLYTFIKDEILCDSTINYRAKQALKDIIPLISIQKEYSILSGGISSLLRHITSSMDELRAVLEQLQYTTTTTRTTTQKWVVLYNPMDYFENKISKWSLTPMVLVFLFVYIGKRKFYHHETLPFIFQNQFLPYWNQMKYKCLMALVVYDYWGRFLYRFSKLRQIKIHHSRVLMTLRLFLLCQNILDRSRQTTTNAKTTSTTTISSSTTTPLTKTRRLLIDTPIVSDIDDNYKSASTLLIEKIPLPYEYYDSSHEPFGLTAFKHGSNVLLASSGALFNLFRHHTGLFNRFAPYLMPFIVPYYMIRLSKASRIATRLLIDNPNVHVIRNGWRVFGESKMACSVSLWQAPKLSLRQEIYVSQNGNGAGRYPRQESDIRVRLFCGRSIEDIKVGQWSRTNVVQLSDQMKSIQVPQNKPILFYIHGGGFFGRFLAKDLLNLSVWAERLGALIVYVDYDLAPETQYPVSLNQCYTVYKWLINGGLGFIPDKIVCFGESAGGNIAAALCLKCISNQIRVPNGIVLTYPALVMHLSPSPSRFLHQSDPLLPRGILELALNSYYPQHGHQDQYIYNIHDPFVSPGLADDRMLQYFPSATLVVGDLDPLLDDSVDFYSRLTGLNVQTELKVYKGLSHGFLIYGDLVHEAQTAIDEICDKIHGHFKS